jgi:hypothetical protein
MARSCRRLLDACSLTIVGSNFVASIFAASIFISSIVVALVVATPTILRGQDAAAERRSVLASDLAPVWIPPPNPPRTYPVGRDPHTPDPRIFPQLVQAAGIIFSGRVTSIGRGPSTSGHGPDATGITFQVEHGMRGASAGQSLTIHEWAGLWTGGERYRVGERVMLFLYSPSRLGLTSPVAGTLGRFAMDSQGRIIMSPRHVVSFAADPILGGKTEVPYADFVLAVRSRRE